MRIDVTFESEDKQRLAEALGSQTQVDRLAALVARAGATEVLEQATGKAMTTTLSELRSFRIRCLFRAGLSVDEAENLVSALFKVSSSTARKYIDDAIARFDIELRPFVVDAAKKVLEDDRLIDWSDGAWEISMPCEAVRKWMHEQVSKSSKPNPRRSDRAGVWRYPKSSYEYLCGIFQLQPKSPS
ncbi:hypothetical protein [Streptomyces chartreusis]